MVWGLLFKKWTFETLNEKEKGDGNWTSSEGEEKPEKQIKYRLLWPAPAVLPLKMDLPVIKFLAHFFYIFKQNLRISKVNAKGKERGERCKEKKKYILIFT